MKKRPNQFLQMLITTSFPLHADPLMRRPFTAYLPFGPRGSTVSGRQT
jgi:hypothetical protein